MLKIGDFSSLAQVSIKTLRYYDQTGLLTPASIDPVTGYRYYSASQLSRLHRILALKDFGFALEQIATVLRDGVTGEQMRGMLLLRESEQKQRVSEESDRLSRLTNRIRLIEQESLMNYDVIIKDVPAQWIASTRQTIPSYQSVGPLYARVAAAIRPSMAQSLISFAIWHDLEYKEHDVDAEAGFYFKDEVPSGDGVSVYQLPAVKAATTIHNGSYQQLPRAYDALLRWIASNGYQIDAPIRELYVYCALPVRIDDESYVTELQVPVRKG